MGQYRYRGMIGAGAIVAASGGHRRRIGPTHRIATILGQSEPEHILLSSADGAPTKPALAHDNRVKFVYLNPNASDPRPLVSKWLVASDGSLTGAMIALANMLMACGGPLDTWEIGWITYTGLGWGSLFNDGSSSFPFATNATILNALSAPPSRQYQSWLSANRTLGNGYARGFENLWLATDNGAPITAPHNVLNNSGSGTSFTANHLMPETFDPAVSIPVLGQHKFDVRQDNDSYDTPAGGAAHTDFTSRDVGRCRDSVTAFFAGPNTGPAIRGPELCSYLNGYASGGGWTDHAHPGSNDEDGIQRYAAHVAYGIAQSFGLAAAQPEITSVVWTPQKVTISSSAGPITNVFAARSETQLSPATFPHYTDAMGFYINDLPAARAEFNGSGGIDLYYGDGTQNFIDTDDIKFLPGGGGASLRAPEDFQNGVWKGVPCVDIGVPGDGLMNLRPMVNFNANFPNTLVNTTR